MKKNTRRKRIKERSTVFFPNLFTTGNLFCGFYSIISSLNSNYSLAAYLIMAAALFDLFDGRVARMLNGVSEFGKQYDSLSDMLSFAIAPVILAYLVWFVDLPGHFWLISFLFVSCGALRLAKFNIISSSKSGDFFSGLPIPVAASTIAAGFLFLRHLDITYGWGYHIAVLMFVLSLLMISPVSYRSYKKPEKASKNKMIRNTVLFILLVIVVAINTDVVVFVLCSAYIILGIVMETYKRVLGFFRG
jgi:CDP-diacylglycerol---serine O-phosphatidyltransferase